MFGKRQRDTGPESRVLYNDEGEALEVKQAQVLDQNGHVITGPSESDSSRAQDQAQREAFGTGTGAGSFNSFEELLRQAAEQARQQQGRGDSQGPFGTSSTRRRRPFGGWLLLLFLAVLIPLLLVGGFVFFAVFLGVFLLISAVSGVLQRLGRGRARSRSTTYVIRRR